MPVFFVNGTNDFAYPLDSYAKTYGMVNRERNFRITVNMPHSHQHGWAPMEIGLFIDEHLKDEIPLQKILRPQSRDNRIRAKVKAETKLTSAALHYTVGTGPINKRKWQTVAGHLEDSYMVITPPPKESTVWFLTVKEERGAVVSSEIMFARK
jgi:hypothetical protein